MRLLLKREHPTFFARGIRPKAEYRSRGFYDALLDIPNEEFATISWPANASVSEAVCVAKITGNVGVEALASGTPELCFGDADYIGLPGVYLVRDIEACEAAIADIRRDGAKIGQHPF